jgi:uncharacterized protein
MRNPLQEQLLKAGLVKKSKVAEVVREQNRQRHQKVPPDISDAQRDAQRAHAERVERDRALAAAQKARAQEVERRAQVRQIVESQQVPAVGEIDYRFADGGSIRSMRVDMTLRSQLAKGLLVIVRHGDGYALLPRAAADKVAGRDPAMIVLDHAHRAPQERSDDDPDDAYYSRFKVPDDLIW